MPFMYAINGGIIDWFHFAMTTDEILKKAASAEDMGKNYVSKVEKELQASEKQIRQAIFEKEGEYPHTIRYFCVPDFDGLDFKLYGVAKISNNGATYIFGDDEELLEMLAPDGWGTIAL